MDGGTATENSYCCPYANVLSNIKFLGGEAILPKVFGLNRSLTGVCAFVHMQVLYAFDGRLKQEYTLTPQQFQFQLGKIGGNEENKSS